MKNSEFAKWQSRLDFFQKEFPFGPTQKYFNEEGRLHRDDGPALITPTRITYYQNGRKHGIDADKFGSISYYYENIRIPPKFFHQREQLTIEEVLTHHNVEVRYVGIKMIGLETILNHENTQIIHECHKTGMVLFQIPNILRSPINYLKVINSTPEPDGSYKNYFLCVPPEITTCKQAVAWTFRLDPDDYNPTQET
jgi:hypothetical protein